MGKLPLSKYLGGAIALYSYEADIIGLLLSATEPYSLYPPNITAAANREIIGIVTQIDRKSANVPRANQWLKLAGCQKVFEVSSFTGHGIEELLSYLNIG